MIELSHNTTWETPQAFYDVLHGEFNFTVDVCALSHNAKCKRYFTPMEDGLKQDWTGHTFWMNPPYGRGQNVYVWVKKAFESGNGVCLLPASTDTKWFHEFCMRATEIRFIKDRLWFSLNGKSQRSNHASMIVVFSYVKTSMPKISSITNCRETRQQKLFGNGQC